MDSRLRQRQEQLQNLRDRQEAMRNPTKLPPELTRSRSHPLERLAESEKAAVASTRNVMKRRKSD